MKPLPYALSIVGLAAINLGAFWLALHPNVGERYRAYYIDRTSDCWPAPVSGEVPIGKPVSYLKGDAKSDARNTLRCGWIGFDDYGTWSHGDEAQLALDLRAIGGAHVALEMLPYLVPGSERQRLVARIGTVVLVDVVLDADGPRTVTLDIPPDLAAQDGPTEIVFDLPDAVSPAALGQSADKRRLAVRLISMLVTAND